MGQRMVSITVIQRKREPPSHLHVKRGTRVLGIAEHFRKTVSDKSVLAGVVMRADLQIDGFAFATITVGGLDATDGVISLLRRLRRPDINAILLNGTVIALYNVIDMHAVYEYARKPVIAVTYEESEGIDEFLLAMPEGERRLLIHRRNPERKHVRLANGYDVWVQTVGCSVEDAVRLLSAFTIHGRYAEPLRVARILARALFEFLFCSDSRQQRS